MRPPGYRLVCFSVVDTTKMRGKSPVGLSFNKWEKKGVNTTENAWWLTPKSVGILFVVFTTQMSVNHHAHTFFSHHLWWGPIRIAKEYFMNIFIRKIFWKLTISRKQKKLIDTIQ